MSSFCPVSSVLFLVINLPTNILVCIATKLLNCRPRTRQRGAPWRPTCFCAAFKSGYDVKALRRLPVGLSFRFCPGIPAGDRPSHSCIVSTVHLALSCLGPVDDGGEWWMGEDEAVPTLSKQRRGKSGYRLNATVHQQTLRKRPRTFAERTTRQRLSLMGRNAGHVRLTLRYVAVTCTGHRAWPTATDNVTGSSAAPVFVEKVGLTAFYEKISPGARCMC